MNRDALFSQKSDHWSTPPATKDELYGEFGLNFDPCPLRSSEDGLKVKWTGRVFCNPPYSRIVEFLKKGLFHLAANDCELLVYLIPARTDTAWFHDYCQKGEIRFLRGRLKFVDAKYNAPFPSMVVAAQVAIFPFFGIRISLTDNLLIGVAFTLVSLARSYALRRVFNWIGR